MTIISKNITVSITTISDSPNRSKGIVHVEREDEYDDFGDEWQICESPVDYTMNCVHIGTHP